jgi:hypothetical protein
MAVIAVATGCVDVGRVPDGVAIDNRTAAHIVVINLRLGPRQVAKLPPQTDTRYSFKGCTGPLEFRTDDGRLVKRLEEVCTGGPHVKLTSQDLATSSP